MFTNLWPNKRFRRGSVAAPSITAAALAKGMRLRQSGGGWSGSCPACGYATGFEVTTSTDGRLLMRCHAGGCGWDDLTAALAKAGLWGRGGRSARRAVNGHHGIKKSALARKVEQEETQPQFIAIWRRREPASNTPAEWYLRFRGYYGQIPHCLYFVKAWHRSTRSYYPGLLAPICIAGDRGEGIGIHRTFLRDDGQGKANVQPAKMTLGEITSGSIPLFEPGPQLAIAEGIENALSAAVLFDMPAWSAVSAGNMPSVILPPIVREVIIAADRGAVGEAKADEAAQRWAAMGLQDRVRLPPAGAGDWNDLLRGGSGVQRR
jgi:putative DNA primase/helicase